MDKRRVVQDGGTVKGAGRLLDTFIIVIVVLGYAKIGQLYTFSICSLLYVNCNSITLFSRFKCSEPFHFI